MRRLSLAWPASILVSAMGGKQSYQDIRIIGDIAEALKAWLVRQYGNMVDLEVGGINEGYYAAVGYAAVANEGQWRLSFS